MMCFAQWRVRHRRGVGSNEVRPRKSSSTGRLNRQRQARRMRERATDGLRRQPETSGRRGCGRSKVDRRIDPGRHREGTGRIGSDPSRQTGERYLNVGAKTIVSGNRKAYRDAYATLRNTYGTGANCNREIRRLWLLDDGNCASTAPSTNSSKH
jgi:hypothetical protein